MVLQQEERPLGFGARVVIRAHRMMCKACSNFGQQVVLLRKASASWRKYTEK